VDKDNVEHNTCVRKIITHSYVLLFILNEGAPLLPIKYFLRLGALIGGEIATDLCS
jgi:hypothetical protein